MTIKCSMCSIQVFRLLLPWLLQIFPLITATRGNGSKMHPLGVDVTKQGRKHKLSGSLIAIIVLSAVGSLLLCFLLGWISLFRHRRRFSQSAEAPHVYPSSIARSTGKASTVSYLWHNKNSILLCLCYLWNVFSVPAGQSAGSRPSFSLSFESSVAAYTGSAKTFSAAEIEKATENFQLFESTRGRWIWACLYNLFFLSNSATAENLKVKVLSKYLYEN